MIMMFYSIAIFKIQDWGFVYAKMIEGSSAKTT